MMRVRVGARYRYVPAYLDICDPPYGAQIGILNPGDIVHVRNLPSAPRANTMGHCYIFTASGEFAGLVSVHSLQPRKG